MPSTNISELNDAGVLQSNDQIPLARSGSTYSIKGSQIASKQQLDALAAQVNSGSHGNHTGAITSSGLATTYNEVVPANKGGAGTVNGILKANGSGTVSAAVAGTDYVTPISLEQKISKPSGPVNGQVLTYSSGNWIAADPPTGGGGGMTENLTGDVTSVGAATTYNNVLPANKGGAGTVSGIMKANGSGTVSAAVAGNDYVIPATLSNYATLASLNNKIDNPASKSAGQVLTYSGTNWLAQSLLGYGSGDQLLAETGYQKLPGGLIIQWGSFTCNSSNAIGNPQLIALSIPFPNKIVCALPVADGGDSAATENVWMDWSTLNKTTTTQLGIYTNYTGICKYIAIGY